MSDNVMNWVWIQPSAHDLDIEMEQCRDEGKDPSALETLCEELKTLDFAKAESRERFYAFLDATAQLPVCSGYPYNEPSELDGIRSLRACPTQSSETGLSDDELFDKVYGGWLGRVAGCMLGKPVEGRGSAQIRRYLESQGRWPLQDYFSIEADDETKKECNLSSDWRRMSIEGISRGIEDDDTNYTTTGLAIYKNYGPGFLPEHVADFWLNNLPVLHTCTAERVAYRNLLNLIPPPESAALRNVYREWIGAQIRADFFGYVCPGNPELAAEYAWRDACISHVKNGIYGEMWVAAMLAAAYTTSDVEAVILAGLGQIPSTSRLHESIVGVIEQHRQALTYDEAIERVRAKWNEGKSHHWCHTISNAMLVAIALLWGEKDFTRTLGYSVMPGFDTDCNGATAGSVLGIMLGAKDLPGNWTAPLQDTLETGVAGFHEVTISDMARETIRLMCSPGR